MPTIDVVVPSYRGIHPEANQPLLAMLQQANCNCRDRHGAMLHEPWKCSKGRHSIRQLPQIYQSSVVHWARNQAVARSLYGQPDDGRPQSDYLFLMDDDMLCQPEYLTRLASYKLDIVCGICTIKRDPPRPNIRYWNAEECQFKDPLWWEFDSQKLIEIDAAGAAFMLVKRTVFERMGEAYLDCYFERMEDRKKLAMLPGELSEYWDRKAKLRRERFEQAIATKDWKAADCWWFQFLDNIDDRQRGETGEDIGFCWKAKKLGFKIFADPQVLPGHIGSYGYSIQDYREFAEAAKAEGKLGELTANHAALSPA